MRAAELDNTMKPGKWPEAMCKPLRGARRGKFGVELREGATPAEAAEVDLLVSAVAHADAGRVKGRNAGRVALGPSRRLGPLLGHRRPPLPLRLPDPVCETLRRGREVST